MYILAILLVCPIFLLGADYSRNVTRKSNGEVYIQKIKAVKQEGPTCYMTSASMILNYYGYNVSTKTLKKNKPRTVSIKNMSYTNQQLLTYGLVFSSLPKDTISIFSDSIRKTIDHGILIWWSCDRSLAPESDKKKDKSKSTHRRLITGYVIDRDNKIGEIFYSDSWGTEHINKRMTLYDAYKMTLKRETALQAIYPKVLVPNVLKVILPNEKSEAVQPLKNNISSNSITQKQEVNTSPINKRPLPTWRKRQLETDRMADEILAKEVEKKGK